MLARYPLTTIVYLFELNPDQSESHQIESWVKCIVLVLDHYLETIIFNHINFTPK